MDENVLHLGGGNTNFEQQLNLEGYLDNYKAVMIEAPKFEQT